jgi:trimethylamine--corrinoid protein Co-methyltransferase
MTRSGSAASRLCFLTAQNKTAIYRTAVAILSEVGMVLAHPEATALMVASGCTVTPDGRVLVPERLFESARGSAPTVVDVFDRAGEPAMEQGARNSYFGTGSDLMNTVDVETGERRPSTLDDIARAARLVDGLPNLDFVMSCAYPNDVRVEDAYLLSFAAMAANTTKPIVAVAGSGRELAAICALAEVIRGGAEELSRKPYFLVYDEPTSPLQHPRDSVDKLMLCATAGVPVCYVPAQIAGATAPASVAGHMAQGTAESLFGLVLHQLVRPGAPFVFGHGHPVLDMRTMQSTYNSVEGYLSEAGMVEMAKWLDLPNFGNAGTSDSEAIDAQAGMDIVLETLLVMQAGSNLNHNAGYFDFGLSGSLEGIVITNEAIALCRRLLAGVPVDEETLALDVIAAVGPGGHFLGQRHTRRHVREEHWRPTILNREGREHWLQQGGLDLRERARRRALDILASHQPALPPPAVAQELERILTSRGEDRQPVGTRRASTPMRPAPAQ